MKTIILQRSFNGPWCTLGMLSAPHVPDHLPLFTLEKPWVENFNNVSRIPAGNYVCEYKVSPKFGPCYEVTQVPNRTHILFHSGNSVMDTSGCILLGFEAKTIGETQYLAKSKLAVKYLRSDLALNSDFLLSIRDL